MLWTNLLNLDPFVIVLGGGVFERYFGLDDVMRALMNRISAFIRVIRELAFTLSTM